MLNKQQGVLVAKFSGKIQVGLNLGSPQLGDETPYSLPGVDTKIQRNRLFVSSSPAW